VFALVEAIPLLLTKPSALVGQPLKTLGLRLKTPPGIKSYDLFLLGPPRLDLCVNFGSSWFSVYCVFITLPTEEGRSGSSFPRFRVLSLQEFLSRWVCKVISL